jgi:hypothetical protein
MEAFQESAETGTTEVGDEDEANQAAFDAAFRALFPLMENLERFTRFSRYPAVTMAPLAVYRRLAPGGWRRMLRRRVQQQVSRVVSGLG